MKTRTDRRSQLLAAARAVFAKKGYDEATISEIVSRAGVAQGTFYLYFPGKEALAGAFAEVFAERLAVVAEERTNRCRSFDTAFLRLLESAYEHCMAHESRTRGLTVSRQVPLPIVFEGLQIEAGYRLAIPRLFAALFLLSMTGIVIYIVLDTLSRLLLRHWHESAIEEEKE